MDEARLAEIEKVKKETREALKGKEFKNLSTPEKDKLLETLSKILGLIE